jgi:hypothetical protein
MSPAGTSAAPDVSVHDAAPFDIGTPDAPLAASSQIPSKRRAALSRFALDVVDDDGEHKVGIADAHTIEFAALWPIRMPRDHKEQFHLSGFYLFATTGRHVFCESSLEKACAMELDRDRDVVDVIAQPFRLRWREGQAGRNHVPDFLALLRDGGLRVIDVKPQRKASGDVFVRQTRAAAEACRRLGWEYGIYSEPGRQRARNLRLLAVYRHGMAGYESERAAALGAAAAPTSFGHVVVATGLAPAIARPLIFELVWRRRLTVNLDWPLGDRTAIQSAPAAAPVCVRGVGNG